MAMVLTWSGKTIAPQPSEQFSELVDMVYSPDKHGSLQPAMISAARRYDRVAYPLTGQAELYTALAEGVPVVVLLNLGLSWVPQWHYAVVTGYDSATQEVHLLSGTDPEKRMSFTLFDNVWARGDSWGLAVLAPDKLPAFAGRIRWLEAVTGLERAERIKAALAGYTAATERWPGSYEAWLGTGNALYQLGKLEKSVTSFRRATQIQPDNGIAYNNLASVLAELGRKNEALAAAEKAIECGGPLLETFKQTLLDIEVM